MNRTRPTEHPDIAALALVTVAAVVALVGIGLKAVYAGAGWLQHGTAPDLHGISTLTFLRALAEAPTQPGSHLPAAAQGDQPFAAVFLGLTAVLIALGVAVLALGLRWWFARPPGSGADRGSGWMSRRDLRQLTLRHPEPGRIALGTVGRRRVASRPEQSVLVFGPTRSGKTSRIAVPAIRDWAGPAIIVSTKTDLTHATHHHRRTVGEIAIFDPTTVTGLTAAGWTPLGLAADPREARRVADRFVRVAGTTDGMGSAFWTATAGQLLAPLLHAAAISGQTMAEVARWVRLGDLKEPAETLDHAGALEMGEAVRAVTAQDPRLRDSTLATLRTVLSAYDDETLAVSDACEITADWLLAGNNTLYVVGGSDDQRRLAAIFLALLGEMIDAGYRRTEALRRDSGRPEIRLDPPLLLVLDEAANMAPIPDLATLASTAGGMGVQLLSLYQDRSQLRRIYGHDAADSISNAHTAKLVLGGITDPDTLTYISRLTGEQRTADREGRSRDSSDRAGRVPVQTADAIRRVPSGRGLLLSGAGGAATVRVGPRPRTAL